MKLFAKLKDYNNELEKILDNKTFSSNSKNLLLSMIYKLEVCYRDYDQVKVYSLEKNKFFDCMLNVIRNYCDNIKTVEPNSEGAVILKKHNVEALTNSKERSLLVYPTEQAMLYAICDIEPKYFYIKDDFIFKTVLQRVLVEGYKQNTMEILKNFNGWSWDINQNISKNGRIANLIYQNLLFIMGEEFLYNWRTDKSGQKDYLTEIKSSVKRVTGNDNYYLAFCKLLFIVAKTKNKAKIKETLEERVKEYKKIMKQNPNERKVSNRYIASLKNFYNILFNTNTEYEEIIQLQKYFLVFLKKKIEKTENVDEIVEMLYFLRYYQNIYISEGCLIKDEISLQADLNFVWKLAITKACKLNAIKIISMDIKTNFEIMKYILDTKIIRLEDIKFSLKFNNDDVLITVYDKEIFDKKTNMVINKEDIIIKNNRMLKLFN